MKNKKKILKATVIITFTMSMLLCLFFMRGSAKVSAKDEEHAKNILYISSYSYDWGTVPLQMQGVDEVLSECYSIIYEFMDTKRVSYDVASIELSNKLRNMRKNGYAYDAVIVGDDDALHFIDEYKDEFFKNIPVSYLGINDIEFAERMASDSNITGVVEVLPYEANINLIRSIFPEVDTIVGIVDSTNTGKGEKGQFIEASKKYPQYTFEELNVFDYDKDTVKEKLSEYGNNTVIFYLIMSSDKDGNVYTLDEREEIFKNYCNVPIFRMNQCGITDSVFGGMVVSHYVSGKLAAGIIKSTLSGSDIESRTRIMSTPCEYIFNYKMMEKYGISEVMLPQDSTILNRESLISGRELKIILPFIILSIVFAVLFVLILLKEAKNKQRLNESIRIEQESKEKTQMLEKDINVFRNIVYFTVKQEFSKVILIDVNTREGFMYFEYGKYSNRKYLHDYEEAFLVGIDSVVEEDRERYKRDIKLENIKKQIVDNDGKYIMEFRRISDGNVLWYEYEFTYFDEDKNTILLLKRNIDDFMVREVENKNRLENALMNAQNRNNEKQKYMSSLSHEIRTPVNGVKGLLEIIKDEPDKVEKYIDKAIMATNNLIALINDFLDYSKIESGNMELQKEMTHFDELEEYIKTVIEPLTAKKHQTLECNHYNRIYECVVCDDKKLKQILLNILSNAVKYTPENGKIIFNIEERSLEKDNLVEVSFQVIDNGIGMSEEFLAHAFEPFKQEHQGKSDSTGLGLAITKKLVDLMNGKIKIDSKQEEGTKVTILMIFNGITDIRFVEKKRLEEKKASNIRFKDMTVLVAEDNDINMEIAENMFTKLGMRVIKASDGSEAVEKFKQNEDIDLIIMDVLMPVIDGITASKIIRQTERGKNIVIIMMTANSYIEDEEGIEEAAINYHITKPFERREVVDILVKEFYNKIV